MFLYPQKYEYVQYLKRLPLLKLLCFQLWHWCLLALSIVSYGHAKEEEEEVDELDKMKSTMGSFARQFIMQQLYMEEMTRSGGDSGIKQLRIGNTGTKP